jgi:flavin reductase (DIM6/NTAB) family NADH-FMN oxidoreductase RutF
MKVRKELRKFYHYSFPMQAVLVTCDDTKGKTNAITIAWHTPISVKPPLYGISVGPGRYSHKLIENTKEFVINFAPYNIVEKVDFCGTRSGRNTDKINESGLTLIPSEQLKTKIIKECFAHLECKLHKSITLGDHTFFIGEVVHLSVDKEAYIDDLINNKKVKPCYYIGDHVYTTINETRDKI